MAVHLHDSAPESITCRLVRRGQLPPSDFLVLTLDTFNDDVTGYGFIVNTVGAICNDPGNLWLKRDTRSLLSAPGRTSFW